MKKRTIIILASVFVFLSITIPVLIVRNEQKDWNSKRDWIEKTINKESMQTEADCGIVSVKMLLGFYDIDISYVDLKKDLNSTIEGTDWKNIKKYFNTLSTVKSTDYKDDLGKAKEYLKNGYPLFICWDVDGDPEWSHYSILISIDEKSVWMLDPAERKSLTQYSLDYFLPCWKNEKYWFCVLEESDDNISKEQFTSDK